MEGRGDPLGSADLGTRQLVRRLCASFGSPKDVIGGLKDTAYSILLGLDAEAAPAYISPDERGATVEAGLAAATAALESDGYPSLAQDLGAAAAKLRGCTTCQLLGSMAEAETGVVPALPLRDPAALLSLLLALRGSRASLRQQRFTFQAEQLPLAGATAVELGAGAAATASAALVQLEPAAMGPLTPLPGDAGAAAAALPPLLPLSTRVFEEAPDPHALTDGSSAMAVLLPGEAALPTDALAGSDELRDMASGLSGRPVWAPCDAGALPPLRSPAWLPVPPALAQLRGDSRRGAQPGPLGLPLSLLSMGDEPGSGTLFAGGAAFDAASDAASADSVQALSSGPGGGAGSTSVQPAPVQQVGLSVKLWGLEDAEVAQQALLALQGVSACLRRLQALLGAPDALPRRSALGLLTRLTEAAQLRQRLQHFVAAVSGGCSGSSGSGGGPPSDPVQQAFAVAVGEVLQRQAAALQALELQEGTEWVQTAVGGTCGTRLHSRGLTLLQVALHTGRLQRQLHRLAGLCWCHVGEEGDSASESGSDGADSAARCSRAGSRPCSPCPWESGDFPGGTQLLTYLYRHASEADGSGAAMLRFLFLQALQPYLRHLHAWAYTTHPVSAEFGTAGDKEAFTLDFLPPEERRAGPLVPIEPPAFLRPLHAAFMRAGTQLRLLHSLEPQGQRLAQQLGAIAEAEVLQRRRQQLATSSGGGGGTEVGAFAGAAHTLTSFAAPPAVEAAAEAALQAADGGPREPWLALAGAPAAPLPPSAGGAVDGTQDLHVSAGSLQQAAVVSQEQDGARSAAVDGWLGQMALQRRLAEHAAAADHLGRAAAQRERQAQRAAAQAAALSRQQSSKAALFEEQRGAVREARARRAMQREQVEASDRQAQLQAAQLSQPPGVELGSSLQPAAGAAAAAAGAQYLPPLAPPLHEEESESVPAPLPAVLECCVAQSVLSQYRAVSRACVRLFLDELKVLEQLEALRRYFFMGAGDWADALVATLGAHADALRPLASHQLEAALAEAIRGTSAESDPLAARLRIRLLPPSASAISAQLGAITVPTPQRRARSFWNSASTVTLAPTQLDCLDCIALDFSVDWPLSAVITEDTLQGYAGVFSMLVRLRRVEQLLRALHAPLAARPKSTPELLLSEEDEDACHRRVQRLRAFLHGARQFVAALQAFLHARTAGDAWVHMLAKLMVSSEEVAATLVSRQPSAPMMGLLSRMNSVGPAGKAAHKLAQQLSRALGASQPGSPSAAATARGGSSQLARFNSLLSTASAASSAAPSANTSPRRDGAATARQPSRFAAEKGQEAAAAGAVAAAEVAASEQQQQKQPGPSAATSPTSAAATAGGPGLSHHTSLTSVLLAQAAAEAGAGGAGAALDAAAWARHFQQSLQGIADLQELLDLHRRYVRQASEDYLTFGGNPTVTAAVGGALQRLVDFSFRLRDAVRSGSTASGRHLSGRRREEAWVQALRLGGTWAPLADVMAAFEGSVVQLQGALAGAGASSVLAELQLDGNCFYSRRAAAQARAEGGGARGGGAAAAGGGQL
ncbi:phosphatase 2C 22 [Micractinium conductrix]|uniref:Phosphatase 2C 22 n=1 Tax=Micractinium conductrix TaxID=554055 RepID=A0A2P6VCR7_9CHLO|nr:phosphatase 2C 22 [Micractinium conductrix]|eukprot:PSC71851.1 phosphatase 2C 22 [Micractinium conductrix]